jgi:hypothetical protein
MILAVLSVQKQSPSRKAQAILLLSLFFASQSFAQNQPAEDSCAYRLPHYDEDRSCIETASHVPGSLDPAKFVAFGKDQDSYASFGGEVRETYERFHDPNFGLQPQDPDGYLLQRYLVHADVHFGRSACGYVELLSALANWRAGGPRPLVDEDQLDFHQGFVDFDFGNNQRTQTLVRVGRQEMALGSGRLVALREGTVTNALFAATGRRFCSLPLSRHGLRIG